MADQLVSIEQQAADFAELMQGKLPQEVIDQTTGSVQESAADSHSANGSIASVFIWMKCMCQIDGGQKFMGDSWGISFPGGGALFGDVYLNNGNSLDSLYANTKSFALTATPVYTAFYFYDGNSNLLGNFQAGSVSTVTGTGGGSGSWS